MTDVNQYAKFLPGCDKASVLEEHDNGMTAEMARLFGGIRQTFTTETYIRPIVE